MAIIKKIVWNETFSVGVKEMDVQHQRIIRTFNKLVDNAQVGAGSETVSEVLAEMVEYAFKHFKAEEQLLEHHKYPDLEQHKAEHMDFRLQTAKFCRLTLEQDEKVTHELLNYLHDWWLEHILIKDKEYRVFLERQRIVSMRHLGV